MKKLVLVVEDNDEIRELFTLALEPHCQEVLPFSGAREALAYLKSALTLPDLALVDLMMPEMSGLDFVRALKSDPRLKKIFVVICSGTTDLPNIQAEIGADGHLRKPVNLVELEQLCLDVEPLQHSA